MTRFPKSKVWLCFCMLMAFCSCIIREFDRIEADTKLFERVFDELMEAVAHVLRRDTS